MLRHAIRTTLCGFAIAASLQAVAETERHSSEAGPVTVKEIASGLENAWALAFLPDGKRMLVTERPGRLRVIGLNGSLRATCWRAGGLRPLPGWFARRAIVAGLR